MNSIPCKNPRILVNPKLPELLKKYKAYCFRGQFFEWKKLYQHKLDFDWRTFSVRRNKISLDDVDSCFVVDQVTGEFYPMYYVVPCNHCDICRLRSMNEFSRRCMYESQVYDCYPYFATLTYDDEHLPFDGVSVRDCQLFLKRFRINLQRAGFKDKIRYVLVSEYGSPDKTQRPHYHVIFWNIHSYTTSQYEQVHDLILSSWKNGFVKCRLITPGDDDKGFKYTFKYCKKSVNVPPGMNDTFVLSSRRNGGIGAPFIDSVSDKVRRGLDCTFQFLNKWTSRVEPLVFSPYVLNRIFPSFCRAVSSEFRKLVDEVVMFGKSLELTHDIRYTHRVQCSHAVAQEYSPYFYVGWTCEVPECYSFPVHKFRVDCFDRAYERMCFLRQKLPDLNLAQRVHELRSKFLSKMFMKRVNYDVASLDYYAGLILNSPSPGAVFH